MYTRPMSVGKRRQRWACSFVFITGGDLFAGMCSNGINDHNNAGHKLVFLLLNMPFHLSPCLVSFYLLIVSIKTNVAL